MRLSQDFYARVAASPELKPLFPGKSVRCATEEFAAFLVQFLEGDEDRTQYRWWLSLRESHSRFAISERQRAVWLGLMNQTLQALIDDAETRRAMRRFFLVTSAYILGLEESDIEHPELEQRWGQQRDLDGLIDDIAKGRDAEAIALSPQFASKPSVFVGILARMMEAGREPLVEFVLQSVRKDIHLGERRFNGRSLLHHAAGAPSLPVVRQLLELGTDPNILDVGGHTPLYRVAGKRREETTGVVEALLRAGASVDHRGGNTSTPLHQAARYGNLRAAEALLAAGANPAARDGKGFTPLDRATKCRRYDVAALLAAR